MKIFTISLMLVMCCCHICLGKEAPVELQMVGDCVNGQGAITFYDGSRYAGQFKDGELNGHGTLTFPDGSRYEGEFRNGQMNGKGTMTFSGGSEYIGEFRDGALCGHGTITFPDGSLYKGQFKNNNYHGKGIWSSPFGIRYEGQFRNGKFDGQGIYSLPDGSRYIGYFKDDLFHGQDAWAVDGLPNDKKDSPQPELKETAAINDTDSPDERVLPFAETGEPEHAAVSLEDEVSFSEGKRQITESPGQNARRLSREDIESLSGSREEEGIAAAYSVEEQNKQIPAMGTEALADTERSEKQSLPVHGLYTGGTETTYASSELAFSVQVGAFLSKNNAEKLAVLLREKGYNARLLLLNDYADRSWYTVRLGSYSSLQKAQEQAVAFSEKESMTATVRPVDSL